MKCFAFIAVLCLFGACTAQNIGMGLDFLSDNVLNPMLSQITSNAVSLLGQQLQSLLDNLFAGIGKRALPDLLSGNLAQLLGPFINQVKEIYQQVFSAFLQIVQHAEEWIQKPDWARMKLAIAGGNAELALQQLGVNFSALQPYIGLIQSHLQNLVPGLEAIVNQLLSGIQHPVQSLIGAGSLLQP